MANLTGLSSLRSNPFTGQTSLPPKSPTPIAKPLSICNPNPDDGSLSSSSSSLHMQRSSLANVLLEEQPSWLEDLLNEPETPANKVAHRRSSSDPFTYLDTNSRAKEEFQFGDNPSWGLRNQRVSYHEVPLQGPSAITSGKPIITSQEQESNGKSNILSKLPLNASAFSNGLAPQKQDAVSKISGVTFSQHQEPNMIQSTGNERQNQVESSLRTTDNMDGGNESDHNESSTKRDSKLVKQHNAQRSRVRKLQFIAELERRVQALQAGALELSAELEFIHQQNIIFGMENRALKQQLESLSQVHFIKLYERDILEREIGRLQHLYHQQLHFQQQQHHHPLHHRVRSLDIESRFANLNLKPKEVAPSNDGSRDSH